MPRQKQTTAEFFAERSGKADIQAARRLLKRSGGEPPQPSDRLDEDEAGEGLA